MNTGILYLHGMGGSPADWDEVRALAPGSAPPIPLAVNPSACAQQLADTITKPGWLCGYSLGGRLAILLAEELCRRGTPPKGLVLLAAGLGFPSSVESGERAKIDEEWADLATRNPEKFWEDWYRQPLFTSLAALPEARRQAWLARRKSMDSRVLAHQLRALGPARHEYLLPKLQSLKNSGISVLYITGDLDKKYLQLEAKLAAEGFSTLRLAGSGHLLPLEAPAALGEILRSRALAP